MAARRPPPFPPLRFSGGDHARNLNRVEDLIRKHLGGEYATWVRDQIAGQATTSTSSPAGGIGLIQYAKPDGDDNADGTTWDKALRTGYVGYDHIASAGGGELHFADFTEWGGPVANQGIWLRRDAYSALAPGFQETVPCRFTGHGSSRMPFSRPGAALVAGEAFGGGRLKPAIWLCGSGFHPVVFENIIAGYSNTVNQLVRCGWDYRRTTAGAIEWANITQWARSAGQAVLNVTLPAGIAITSASRLANVVTLNFSFATVPNATPFQWIRVTSNDGNFPSGDYVVTDLNSGHTWLTYTNAGADVSGGAIGNFASHGVKQYDRIEVVSTDAEVPTTAYRVLSATADTITVVDSYGFAPRNASVTVANPGQYVLQDRSNYAAGLVDFLNVSGAPSATHGIDQFVNGPTYDFGGTTDGRILLDGSSCAGYVPVVPTTDLDRGCWLLADPGPNGACGMQVRFQRPQGSGMRVYGSKIASWAFKTEWVEGDTQVGVTAPPQLEIVEGGTFGDVFARQIRTFDNPVNATTVFSDQRGGFLVIDDCDIIDTSRTTPPLAIVRAPWFSGGESAITKKQIGFWLDRSNADVPHGRRAFSPLTPRYQNWINDSSTWDLQGGQITAAAIADPMSEGGTTATRLTRVSGDQACYFYPQDTRINPHTGSPVTHVVGDGWVFGAWLRGTGGEGTPGITLSFGMAGNNGAFGHNFTRPYPGDGEWWWYVWGARLTTVNVSDSGIRAAIGVTTTVDVFEPVMLRVPNGQMSENEFNEWVLSLQTTPFYLPPGVAGTRVGQKFIAHGGMGMAAATVIAHDVGTPAFTAGYERRYGTDGATILGYVPLMDTPGTHADELIIENVTVDPAAPDVGRIWLRTDL